MPFTFLMSSPLLVLIISLTSIFMGREAVEGQIYAQLGGFMGDDAAKELEDIIRKAAITGKGIEFTIVDWTNLESFEIIFDSEGPLFEQTVTQKRFG